MKLPAILLMTLTFTSGLLCQPISTLPAVETSFQGLGQLGGQNYSEATAVSGNGKVAVGHASTEAGEVAFRWENSVMTGLEPLPGASQVRAYAVSYDGSVIVGRCDSSSKGVAFHWTAQSGTQTFEGLRDDQMDSVALAVSADGSTIVGSWNLRHVDGSDHQFIWTSQAGISDLGETLGLSTQAGVHAISADASVIAGYQIEDSGTYAPFRWSAQTGLLDLHNLCRDGSCPFIKAVSADGSTLVGGFESEAFRWTQESGITLLGELAGGDHFSTANAVSGDGRIVVGKSLIYTITAFDLESPQNHDLGYNACIWDEAHGMRDLRVVLVNDYGLDLSGWELVSANGISQDGTTIVGLGLHGGHREGWIARLPAAAE